jgi:hypothetical protein
MTGLTLPFRRRSIAVRTTPEEDPSKEGILDLGQTSAKEKEGYECGTAQIDRLSLTSMKRSCEERDRLPAKVLY